VWATLRVFADVAHNRALRRVTMAYAGFIVTEYAVWIAMLVYAYGHGGATVAGLVALAQLAPAAVVAPLAAPLADRRSPVVLLAGGYAVQAVALAATASAVAANSTPLWAYLGAVVASTAVSTTRPAQSTLVPALAHEVKELTASNVVFGWVESLSILVAGAAVGLALTFSSVAYVFAAGAVILAGAGLLVAPLRTQAPGAGRMPRSTLALVGDGFAALRESSAARLLVTLLGAEFVVVGALDVLFVVMAIDVLQVGQGWVGYLNMAYGAGGVVLASMAVLLVGRRLGPVIMATAGFLGVALAATALAPGPLTAASLLAVVGGSRALFDLGVRALLQRAVAADMVARIFGLAEGLSMAGLAAGSLLAPALVAVVGGRWALVGLATLLPALVLARAGLLRGLDQHAQIPIVEISLLRSLTLFRDLPCPALEGLARALERVEHPAGTVIVREGDQGDCYYALVDGTVDISRKGHHIRTLGRGDGLGEIALLRTGRRTATAVAASAVTVYRLDRDSFLTAVNDHAPTLQVASDMVRATEVRDARRDAAGEQPPP
jgi:MFS family permease